MSSSYNDYDAIKRVVGDEPTRPPRQYQQLASAQDTKQQQQRNIGILSIAAYFPKTYVSQEDLEKFDSVDSGKYTKGLMQDKMGFCTDLEDINSIALTVTKRLIDESGVSLQDIGYLEVGTETILDKSKSVKTVLMELFEQSSNTDIEGVDTTNACYGGTAALFHAIDHCSAPHWDGRLAIVVAADIAVYERGAARPTGGCGAIAMLIGPNAPLVFEPFRATHMTHTYDFYKPDPASEYPTVDGKLSLQAYISAIDKCYQAYRKKYFQYYSEKDSSQLALLDEFDGILMHSPYCKLVRKAFARVLFNEFDIIAKNNSAVVDAVAPSDERYRGFLEQIPREELSMEYDSWLKPIGKLSLEKVAISSSEQLYQQKTAESLFLSNQVGNMYTASLYSCLVAYLTSKPSIEQLVNKPLLFFSYGSGSAASMFSARINGDTQAIKRLLHGIQDVREKLQQRLKITPEEFTAHLEHKKKTFSLPSRSPTGQPVEATDSDKVGQVTIDEYLYPGTYYLASVDHMFRRQYHVVPSNQLIEQNNNNDANCIVNTKQSHSIVNTNAANTVVEEQQTPMTTA